MHQARGELASLVAAAGQGQGTRIGKDEPGRCAVLAPLSWLGEDHRRLVPALAQIPVTAARAKLGELVTAAACGAPQVLTRRGAPVAVLMADVPAPAVAGPAGGQPTRAGTSARRRLAALGETLGELAPRAEALSFGLPPLDEAARVLAAGCLAVVAAAPGAGGSLLAVAAARATALGQGRPVLYAASGPARQDVAARVVAAETQVDYQRLRAGTLPPAQQVAVQEVTARLVRAPLHIDDGSDLSAEAIAETAPDVEDLALVVVDRLHHQPVAHLPLSGQALPGAARTLAALARRLQVPVLAVVDTDDPATVAALDADVTMVVTRDGDRAQATVGERDLGPLVSVRLGADFARARFTAPSKDAPAEPAAPSPVSSAPAHPAPAAEPSTAAPTAPATPPGTPTAPASGATAAAVGEPPAVAVARGPVAPCADCGAPTPYRIGGRPAHMRGFCRTTAETAPGAVPVPVPAPPAAPDFAAAPEDRTAPATAPAERERERPGAWPAGTGRPAPGSQPPPALPAVPGARAAEATGPHPQGEEDIGQEDSSEDAFAWGPFAVLDGHGTAHLADGATMPCPAATIRELAQWVADRPLGSRRLKPHGRDGDPLVVLMPEAAERLGLPAREDPAFRALPADHPVLADLAAHGWEVPQRGGRPWFSAWVRVFQRVERGRRSVQLAVLPWGALSPSLGWPLPVDKDTKRPLSTTAEVVAFLNAYSRRVMTPVSSSAATGQELMVALRPPTRAWREPGAQKTGSAWVPGALHVPVEPAPCEVNREHPLAKGRDHTDPAQTLMEEALQWWRMPTDAERAWPHVVAFDVNCAFGAAANKLTVGTGGCYHLPRARFDAKLPGSWLCDLSGIETDPRLPSPFTPDGRPPAGPAWYATPTLAYAVERGFAPPPMEAWVRPNDRQAAALGIAPADLSAPLDAQGRPKTPPVPPFGNGPYLTDWYEHLRDAYLDTYARLGITPGLEPQEFLAAMARLGDAKFRAQHAVELRVLQAIKATFKGAIGKLRERPHDLGRRGDPHAPWPALQRPTWRPDIRAAVIARSRTNLHRKITATAAATGAYPLAVYVDCVLYASPTPDIQWLTGHKGGFRLGPNPGLVKPEPSHPMDWYLDLTARKANPGRYIKGDGTDAAATEGE
ncbi:type II toxin-antitoxin system prevent-host-death family antitoxin [Streptomyces carminius]|uniref:type II toxin-antitoxin system prevent-host-death family antitoxin n=1 Tax=Streptomyces carminius TaxID=2665496 RepID=UPI0013047918|nr:type II toxin-antitoxin system prevent-host-death family antitoxin [Streptomyces carminius]